MSDDQSKRGAADRDRIDVTEAYELRGWADRFHISPDKLKDAVAKVGPLAVDVAKYLQKSL